ncbi:hypothetical protein BD408DRAFT_407986 [Parasitella parasitica]|nr:hypothetical protein BD408DRAFT_407986 [Parasitella parasitica]
MSRIQQGIAKEHPEWILPRLCQQNANKTGVYAAIFAGIVTLPIARRFLDKNRALFSALGASGLAGYIAAKYSFAYCEKTYGFFQSMEHIQTEELKAPNGSKQNSTDLH